MFNVWLLLILTHIVFISCQLAYHIYIAHWTAHPHMLWKSLGNPWMTFVRKYKDFIGKDVCGIGFGLFEGTVPPIAWRAWGKRWKSQTGFSSRCSNNLTWDSWTSQLQERLFLRVVLFTANALKSPTNMFSQCYPVSMHPILSSCIYRGVGRILTNRSQSLRHWWGGSGTGNWFLLHFTHWCWGGKCTNTSTGRWVRIWRCHYKHVVNRCGWTLFCADIFTNYR